MFSGEISWKYFIGVSFHYAVQSNSANLGWFYLPDRSGANFYIEKTSIFGEFLNFLFLHVFFGLSNIGYL